MLPIRLHSIAILCEHAVDCIARSNVATVLASVCSMPVISVGRDKLFKALGRAYSKLLPFVASGCSADARP